MRTKAGRNGLRIGMLALAVIGTWGATAHAQEGGAYLGVTLSEPATGGGASVAGVVEDSPAARANLQPGDVITAVNGEAVEGILDLVSKIRAHRPGVTVVLTLRRGDEELTQAVELTARPADIAPRPEARGGEAEQEGQVEEEERGAGEPLRRIRPRQPEIESRLREIQRQMEKQLEEFERTRRELEERLQALERGEKDRGSEEEKEEEAEAREQGFPFRFRGIPRFEWRYDFDPNRFPWFRFEGDLQGLRELLKKHAGEDGIWYFDGRTWLGDKGVSVEAKDGEITIHLKGAGPRKIRVVDEKGNVLFEHEGEEPAKTEKDRSQA